MNNNERIIKVYMKKVFVLLLLCVAVSAGAEEMPEAPDGYSWVKYCEDKCAILKPDGWFYRTGKQGGNEVHSVSVEDSEKKGKFDTGLTVIIRRDVEKKYKMSATEVAKKFVDIACKSCRQLQRWEKNLGPFKGFGCLVSKKYSDNVTMVMHYMVVANDKTGTVFVFLFESPEKQWEQAWKKGDVMMEKLMIDDEV